MDYLLKASAVLIIFFTCYKLLLQNDTFFKENRWFLFIGIVVSLTIPKVVIPIYVEYVPETINSFVIEPSIITTEQASTIEESSITLSSVLTWIYFAGLFVFAIKFLLEIFSLTHLIRTSQITKEGRYRFTKVNDNIAPFSFFNWIVLNPKQFLPQELNLIVKHEKVHVKQLHSLDLILAQILCIILWFNPFVWFYKKSLNQNLEYIADSDTLETTSCEKSYQELLLKTSINDYNMSFVNNFYNSLIKKRILMLHKSKSQKKNQWKYLTTLPLLALFLMSFNTKEFLVEAPEADQVFSVSANTNDKSLEAIEKAFSTKDTKLKFTDLVRNDEGEIQRVSINTKYPESNRFVKRMTLNNNLKAKSIEPFNLHFDETENIIDFSFADDEVTSNISSNSIAFSNTNSVSNFNYSTNSISGEKELVVITKSTNKETLEDIKKQFKKVGVSLKFSSVKRNKKDEITAINISAKSKNSEVSYSAKDDDAIEPITIKYFDGNIYIGKGVSEHSNGEYHFKTKSVKFKSGKNNEGNVYILSGDGEGHDEEHEDTHVFITKDGVKHKVKSSSNAIIIQSDDDSKDGEIIILNNKVGDEDKDTNVWTTKDKLQIENYKDYLFIKDGKEISVEELEKIYPKLVETNSISTFDIYKGKKATEKYGAKGKNGVLVITTGKGSKKNKKKYVFRTNGEDNDNHETEIIIKDGDSNVWTTDENVVIKKIGKDKKNFYFISSDNEDGKKPLFIIDGKEMNKKDALNFDHDKIEKIEVLKGDDATKKYGDKGKNGVVLIYTKK